MGNKNVMETIHVLLVEDDSEDARLVKEELQSGHSQTVMQAEWVNSLQKGLDFLDSHRVHALLLDLSLPNHEGLSTLETVLARAPQLPVIVMTDSTDEEMGMQALQAGAQDYLIKGQINGPLLKRMIQYAIQRKQTELQLADTLKLTEHILTSSPIGILTYRLTGECLSANAYAARMIGTTIEQLKTQNFRELESWKRSGLYQLAEQAIASKTLTAADVHIVTTFEKDAWFQAQFITFKSAVEELLLLIIGDITERKRVEEALRQSEENYRQLFDAESDAIFLIENETGEILQANHAASVLYGYSQEELLTKTDIDLSAEPEQTRQVTTTASTVPGQVITIPLRIHRKKDGSVFPVEVTARFFVHQGRHVHIAANRDITERKRTEAALEASEKRFRTWIENSSDLITVLDIGGTILYESPALKPLLGYSAEELLGTNVFDLLHPDDLPGVMAIFAQSIQELGITASAEYRIRHREGSWRCFESTGSSYIDEHGDTVILIHSRDITDRKQAEATVTTLQKRFQALIEHAPDGIALLGLDGKLRQVTPSTQQILEYSLQEAEGQDPALLTHPDDLPALLGLLNDLIQNPGKVVKTQYRFRHKNGSWRWLESTISNLVAEPGVEAIVFNYRDITEQKQAEATLLEKEQLLSEAQRIGHIGSWSYDILTDRMKFSDEMYRLLDVVPEEFQHNSQNFLALLYPADRRLAEKWLDDLKTGRQSKELNIRLFRKSGALRYLQGTGAVNFDHEGRPVNFIGTMQDVTERKAAELQINQQLRHLTALSEIDRAIISSFDRRYTLGVILSQVHLQLQADATDILILDSAGQPLEYVVGQGFRTMDTESAPLPAHGNYAGRVAKERRLLHIQDLRGQLNSEAFKKFIAAEGFVAYLGVPLIVKGRVKGVLELFQRTPLQPYQEWLDFLQALAGQAAIAIENASLFGDLQASNRELFQAYDATIEGWSRAMDLRDKETEGHTQRVTNLTVRLAQAAGMEAAQQIHIRRGALLHDIGKLGVPDHILLKQDQLTPEEWTIMRKHPEFAYEMLAPIAYLRPALSIPYCHHEKWDGTGYPRGLKGEEIPLEARLFAVVDVWDAITSDRPYRLAWSAAEALNYIREQSGKHFDPQVVELFFKTIR